MSLSSGVGAVSISSKAFLASLSVSFLISLLITPLISSFLFVFVSSSFLRNISIAFFSAASISLFCLSRCFFSFFIVFKVFSACSPFFRNFFIKNLTPTTPADTAKSPTPAPVAIPKAPITAPTPAYVPPIIAMFFTMPFAKPKIFLPRSFHVEFFSANCSAVIRSICCSMIAFIFSAIFSAIFSIFSCSIPLSSRSSFIFSFQKFNFAVSLTASLAWSSFFFSSSISFCLASLFFSFFLRLSLFLGLNDSRSFNSLLNPSKSLSIFAISGSPSINPFNSSMSLSSKLSKISWGSISIKPKLSSDSLACWAISPIFPLLSSSSSFSPSVASFFTSLGRFPTFFACFSIFVFVSSVFFSTFLWVESFSGVTLFSPSSCSGCCGFSFTI